MQIEMPGWCKLWRKISSSQVWSHDGMLKVFTACLIRANHKEKQVPVDNMLEPVVVKRGQFITGRYDFHSFCYPIKRSGNPTPETLIRWLKKLEKQQMLIIETNSRYTLITVRNYESYQGSETDNDHQNDQRMIIKRSSDDHQVITTKNDLRSIKNDKELYGAGNCENFESPFDPVKDEVLAAWKRQREAVGLAFVRDRRTQEAAAEAATLIGSGEADIAMLEKGMKNLLRDSEAREKYTLKGLVNNLSNWLDPRTGGKVQIPTEQSDKIFSGECSCGKQIRISKKISSSEWQEPCPDCGVWVDLKRTTKKESEAAV